ncbi:MAG TPA: hypothetical protein VG370_09460 [Chloroflexota bacterium]|nr:hypothetical protein [Chloroflexota bacterium]
MLGVEQQHAHLLLLEAGHLEADQAVDVLRRGDLRPQVRRRLGHPPADRDRRLELGDLGVLEAALPGELRDARPLEAPEAAELLEQLGGQLGDHLAGHADPQDDRQQVGVGEVPLVAPQEPLARPLRRRQVLDGVGRTRLTVLGVAHAARLAGVRGHGSGHRHGHSTAAYD